MAGPGELRLAELVASLSSATDLGLGQPEEHTVPRRRAAVAGLTHRELEELAGSSLDPLSSRDFGALGALCAPQVASRARSSRRAW